MGYFGVEWPVTLGYLAFQVYENYVEAHVHYSHGPTIRDLGVSRTKGALMQTPSDDDPIPQKDPKFGTHHIPSSIYHIPYALYHMLIPYHNGPYTIR